MSEDEGVPPLASTDDDSSEDDDVNAPDRAAPRVSKKLSAKGRAHAKKINSQQSDDEEQSGCSAAGDGCFPVNESDKNLRPNMPRQGDAMGEGARVYASVSRFATDKEKKDILRSVRLDLVSTRMACYEKGYAQYVYPLSIFTDFRKKPLDGILTRYWDKTYPKGKAKEGELFKLYLLNASTRTHADTNRRKKENVCICRECRLGPGKQDKDAFRGRVTAFQSDIDAKTGWVLFEFIGDEDDVLVKPGNHPVSQAGKQNIHKMAQISKTSVGTNKINASNVHYSAHPSEGCVAFCAINRSPYFPFLLSIDTQARHTRQKTERLNNRLILAPVSKQSMPWPIIKTNSRYLTTARK